MFRVKLYLLLFLMSAADIIFSPVKLAAEIIIGDVPIDENPNAAFGLPRSEYSHSILISRSQYVISWGIDRRAPDWVSWSVREQNLGDYPRGKAFHVDQDLEATLREQNRKSVSPSDYRNSCLDRGHQVPSADRTATQTDNESTFLMSNVIPQSAYLNRRTWVSLERFVRRRILMKNEHAQIYAGAIYSQTPGTIGPAKDIHVPESNFKIIILFPNEGAEQQRKNAKYFVVNFANVTSQGTSPVVDYAQACVDSAQTPRLADHESQPLWRPYLAHLNMVEEQSGLSFAFLQSARQLSIPEVDQLIEEDSPSTFLGRFFMEQIFAAPRHRIFLLPQQL